MAKSIKDILLDDKPKIAKKIAKALGEPDQNPERYAQLERLKNDLRADNFLEFPKVKMVVTPTLLAYVDFSLAHNLVMVEMDQIRNAYRKNIYNGEYDFDNFYLGIELLDGQCYGIAPIIRNGDRNIDVYEPVIEAIHCRAANWKRGD